MSPTGDINWPGLVPADEELWFRPKFPKPSAPAPSPAKYSGSPARLSRLRGSRQATFPVPGLDARNPFRASSNPTSLSSRRFPASLERPGFAIRGEPARRGGDSLDRRLLSGSPLGVRLGERRQEKPRHFVLALRPHASLGLSKGTPTLALPRRGGIQVIVLSPDTSRLTELTPSLLVTCHLQLKSLLTPHTSRLADL